MHGNAKINEREIIKPSQKLHKKWKCIKLETDIDGVLLRSSLIKELAYIYL